MCFELEEKLWFLFVVEKVVTDVAELNDFINSGLLVLYFIVALYTVYYNLKNKEFGHVEPFSNKYQNRE